VIFFDDFEQAPQKTQEWVWVELFAAFADRRIENLKFVVMTTERPNGGNPIERFLEIMFLEPLQTNHIIEYMLHRGLNRSTEELRFAAEMMRLATRGSMKEVAYAIDALLESQQVSFP
jgi:hypothetical protein